MPDLKSPKPLQDHLESVFSFDERQRMEWAAQAFNLTGGGGCGQALSGAPLAVLLLFADSAILLWTDPAAHRVPLMLPLVDVSTGQLLKFAQILGWNVRTFLSPQSSVI